MGSERSPDKFVIGRILEAINEGGGRRADSAIQGRANLSPDSYREYKEILLSTNDIALAPRPSDGRLVPILTKEGIETLAIYRRDALRYGKENLIVEEIRRRHAALREARKKKGKARTPTGSTDSQADAASDS